tara:strand:+ start:184 stop:1206 length:1023 start_codon:yes stop_codon:yes gene_type:complete
MNNDLVILGIESSCDDTSAAILRGSKVLSNIVANQSIHEKFGGVVPELASRAHQQNIVPVIDTAIKEANVTKTDIDLIAYTKGPGLLGSLLVGSSFAKSLSLALNKPLVSVNHMQAHILAHFIEHEDQKKPEFPFLCLTVSGGHTQIVEVNGFNKMKIIGTTLDDAAGEAFDKSAKVLGLKYPGGPLIDKYAKNGNINSYVFGKPKIKGLDFSFSGLKTSIMNTINTSLLKDPNFIKNNLNDLCASIQYSIIKILLDKIIIASNKTGISNIAIAGGVSANSYLRKKLSELGSEKNFKIYIPKFEYCTDNGAMIAIAGKYKYINEKSKTDYSESASARLSF